MKINKLFLYSLLALLTSCSQEELMVVEKPVAGEEVHFGMSLDENTVTRTIYGEESGNKFPIYWENGDEVRIVSPHCLAGRNQAGYRVTVGTDNSNVAQSLTKIGNVGIQWGYTETANFYSVYPLENVSSPVISGDNAIFNITMPAEQNILLEDDVKGKPTMKRPEMEACFMYAGVVGPNVAGTKNVNLTYKPLSTAIRFTLTGPKATTYATSGDVIVSKIVLTAPTGTAITGEFKTQVSVSTDNDGKETLTATVSPVAGKTSNEVTIYSHYDEGTNSGYLTLRQGETIDMCAFVMLKEDTDFSNWKMTIHLASGATFTKTLKLTGKGENSNTLVARKVNKVPQLPEMYNSTSDWNPANWMVNIPRNVYLSEISIPGSWNSLNPEFSPNNDITEQYKYGIRAFHLDTRWKRTGLFSWNYKYVLGIADGGRTSSGSSDKYMTDSDNTEFSTALKNITDNVKQNEYMLVFVTFAQNSADYERDNGGWQKAVSDACNNITSVISADDINANTVVGDVLGKVIVVINNTDEMDSYTPPADSKCFFSYIPMELKSNMFTNVTTNNNVYNADAMHYASGAESGITLYNHHAQVTSANADNGVESTSRGYMPSIKERQAMVTNIWNWADANYAKEDYAHSAWIYLGMGGYYSNTSGASTGTAHKGVAYAMNQFVNDRINNMSSRPTSEQTAYHPVGIVFMNYTDTHQGTVKNILQLNTKYRQAYDPDWTPGGTDNARSDVQTVAAGYSSGMVDNNQKAIGWD